jgi:hypothetical protein
VAKGVWEQELVYWVEWLDAQRQIYGMWFMLLEFLFQLLDGEMEVRSIHGGSSVRHRQMANWQGVATSC